MEEQRKLTKARARVLQKAAAGYVMISGGFSDAPSPHCLFSRNFDRRYLIEDLWLHFEFLQPGEHANQFVLTEKGRMAVSAIPKRMLWHYDPNQDIDMLEIQRRGISV